LDGGLISRQLRTCCNDTIAFVLYIAFSKLARDVIKNTRLCGSRASQYSPFFSYACFSFVDRLGYIPHKQTVVKDRHFDHETVVLDNMHSITALLKTAFSIRWRRFVYGLRHQIYCSVDVNHKRPSVSGVSSCRYGIVGLKFTLARITHPNQYLPCFTTNHNTDSTGPDACYCSASQASS